MPRADAPLHDQSLAAIHLDWVTGSATITVYSGTISCTGVKSLHVPRENPWGPSVYINEMIETSLEEGSSHRRLTIRMGSGDEIEIIAETVDLSKVSLARSPKLRAGVHPLPPES